ncbi:MAG: ATP-dependent Clp protease proteolytic subunit [Ruminiclostridium sp.]|nr:ATP-dependent Clp protease proteolytic subunit [Ruminiclostridium sp.]
MNPIIVTNTKGVKIQSDIFSKQFSRRIIYLIGEINDITATEIIAQLDYLDNESDEDITMIINSPGGIVSSGFAIIDAMNRSRCIIKTQVTGIAASMAAVIAANGTRGYRYVTPLAKMMLHQPLGGACGQATDIEVSAREILKVKKLISIMLSEITGKPINKISADCERDFYLDSQAAVEYGVADRICSSSVY